MTTIVDDRSGKSSDSKGLADRERFLKRYRKQIKRAVQKDFENRTITDAGDGGIDINVDNDDASIDEPTFHHGQGGNRDIIHPGNKEFQKGDELPRPPGGGGGGAGEGDPSNSGEGEDGFMFSISQDEYLEFLFDGLELPNLDKKVTSDTTETERHRAGIVSSGAMAKMDMVRSAGRKKARLGALKGPEKKAIIEILKQKKLVFSANDNDLSDEFNEENTGFSIAPKLSLNDQMKNFRADVLQLMEDKGHQLSQRELDLLESLDQQIVELEEKMKNKKGWDPTDLRFKADENVPVPTSKAVMFALMDVSGSMNQQTKDLAKRFFVLLHLFLKRNYEKADVVFICHHTSAKEVDEEEFFYGRETGGTIVSSALELMIKIMEERYPPSEWNVYGAQASDGDNWNDDTAYCLDLMRDKILPQTQCFFYTEIDNRRHQHLWYGYERLSQEFPGELRIGHVKGPEDIKPVFRDFLKKEGASNDQVSAFAPKAP